MQDLQTAFEEEKAPFYDKGEQKLNFSRINFKRISIEDLGDELEVSTRRNKHAIIASCSEDHFKDAAAAMKLHNSSTPAGCGKVRRAWATAEDVYGGRNHPPKACGYAPQDVMSLKAAQAEPESLSKAPKTLVGVSGLCTSLFDVTLSKEMSMDRFGFANVPAQDHRSLVITWIDPSGLLAKWNTLHPTSEVREGHIIVAVNGVFEDVQAMRLQLEMNSIILSLKAAQAEPESPSKAPKTLVGLSGLCTSLFDVTLSKEMSMDRFGFANVPAQDHRSLVITWIDPSGLLAKWNTLHPTSEVREGHIIVAVNGVFEDVQAMRLQLEMNSIIQLSLKSEISNAPDYDYHVGRAVH